MAEDPVELMRRAAEAERGPSAPISPADNPLAGAVDYRPPPPPREPTAAYQGAVLPFRKDETGNVTFDPNAGLLGALKKPFDFTYGVRTGEIPADPRDPRYIGGAAETALTYGPGAVASRVGKGGLVAPGVKPLEEAAVGGFKNYRDSLQMYGGDDYRTMLQTAADNLKKAGFHDVADSGALQHEVIRNELNRVKGHPFVTSQDVDALRVQLGGKGLKGPPAAANMALRDELFGYIEKNLPPGSDRSISDAVGNYRQARHSEAVTAKDAATAQKNIAKAQGPELSAEQTRSNIAALINSRRGEGPPGFSDTEMNILRNANRATPWIDRAQALGDRFKLSAPGGAMTPTGFTAGGGLIGATGALLAGHPSAAVTAGAVAAGVGTAGAVARSYANRGARRIAEEADNAIRMQSPLAQQSIGTLPSNFSATPFARPIGTPSGMIEAAMAARAREQAQKQVIQPTYRVLPDGTVEELS